MPFIRTSKGAKIPFSSAKISELISLAYREAYGKNMFKYRGEINSATKETVQTLNDKFGSDINSEWDYYKIIYEIKEILGKNVERGDVYYAFDDFYTSEIASQFDKVKRAEPLKSGFKTRKVFDPLWNIYIRRMETQDEFQIRKQSLIAKGETDIAHIRPRERRGIVNFKQSQWLEFWEKFSLKSPISLDIDLFIKEVKKEKNIQSLYVNDWLQFWNNFIFDRLNKDPRFYGLLSSLAIETMKYQLIGSNIFSFSSLLLDEHYDKKDRIEVDLFSSSTERKTYSSLFQKFITILSFSEGMDAEILNGFDLPELAKHLDPQKDRNIDWRALQLLKKTGALHPISSGTQWKIGNELLTVKEDCYEMPQWMFMRLAISLAAYDKSENDKNTTALQFYKLLSEQKISPTASMLREAGKTRPDYLEDKASVVADKYENIWESINETAVSTKWTGTVTLDWREVRAKNSPIKKGLRESGGVLPFLHTINTSLHAQDREISDKPVTNILPIWHKDVDVLLSPEEYQLDHFNSVVSLSDLFIKRAKNSEIWTMFDPKIFPEILSGKEEDYLLCERKISDIKSKYPKSFKQKRADKILNKISSSLKNGSLYVVFEDNNKNFDVLHGKFSSVNGVDGVGNFNVMKNQEKGDVLFSHWARWPSLAINISHIVDKNGNILSSELRNIISSSLKMLDFAITASEVPLDFLGTDQKHIINRQDVNNFRHTCLGVIGVNETIDKLVKNNDIKNESEMLNWLKAIFTTLQSTVLQEENALTKRYGSADIYKKLPNNADFFFNPSRYIHQLENKRSGSVGLKMSNAESDHISKIRGALKDDGHRMITKTIYAPFDFSSSLAGVSSGGISIPSPMVSIEDDQGIMRTVPTYSFLQIVNDHSDELKEMTKVINNPFKSSSWPDIIKNKFTSNPTVWLKLMKQAAMIRPWVDNGICLTIPSGMKSNEVKTLFEQSWFFGISSIRSHFSNGETKNENEEIDNNDD